MKVTCNACSGKGTIKSLCPTCSGMGLRRMYTNLGDQHIPCPQYVTQKCEHCGGLGSYEVAYKTSSEIVVEQVSDVAAIIPDKPWVTPVLCVVVVLIPIAVVIGCLWLAFHVSAEHNDNIFQRDEAAARTA